METKKIIKFLYEWKGALFLLFICIAGILLTTIYGIQSVNWGNDFWPNALSEFLGMFVEVIFGAIFTFVVIDKYTQYHKDLQWRKIKKITYKNLYFILSNIILKLNLALPTNMRVNAYVLTEDIETLNDYLPSEDLKIVVNSLIENINKIIQEKCKDFSDKETASFIDEALYNALAKFKQHSKSDMNSLSSLTIPKLLNFSINLDFLDNVIELEELFTSLMSKINNPHKKNLNKDNEVKCIWLFKLQEILKMINEIAFLIQNDITMD